MYFVLELIKLHDILVPAVGESPECVGKGRVQVQIVQLELFNKLQTVEGILYQTKYYQQVLRFR